MTSNGFCPQCGTQRQGSLRFCANCGFDYWKAAEAQAEQPQSTTRPELVVPASAAAVPRQGRRWRRWLVWGLGAILALGVVGAIFGKPAEDAQPVAGASATASPTIQEPTAEPTAVPTDRPTARPTKKPQPTATPAPLPPVTYRTVGDRAWRLLVKAPDDYIGNGYVVWACITQFDAATGDDTFRGQASYKNEAYWFSDGDNALFTGTTHQLAKFVQDDVVEMRVVSLGSYSYDTQIGGQTTVPWFSVDKIGRRGTC